MHDGRINTLREVIYQYNSGGQPSLNKNELIRPLGLSESQIDDLAAFILTLRDEDFISNPSFQDPHN